MSQTPLFDCILKYARANFPVSLKTMAQQSGYSKDEVLAILNANRQWLELSGHGNFDSFRKVQFTEVGPPRQVTLLDVARIRAWYAGRLYRARAVGLQKEAMALEFYVGDREAFDVFQELKIAQVIPSLGEEPVEFIKDTLQNRKTLEAYGFVDQDKVKSWSGWAEFPWQEPVEVAADVRYRASQALGGRLSQACATIVRWIETPFAETHRFLKTHF